MLLKLENIRKSYGTPGERNHQVVLDDLSLQINKGDTVAILGDSGSGKSTLLNIIGTLDRPGSGNYIYRDRDITGYSDTELDLFRNKEIGFVFQFHHLLPQCTVLENVLVPVMPNKEELPEKRAYAWYLLERVGLKDHWKKLPGQLSGGECQRAALVRAMINKPSLLLADEPTGALDLQNVERLLEMLVKINQEEQTAIVVVTHSFVVSVAMDYGYQLLHGKLVAI